MGRAQLWRRVSAIPPVNYFKPIGVPMSGLREVRLLVEEAESIRLKDLEGLEQEECSQKMKISRTTFARLLETARQKVADALLNGKAIRIEGGNYEMNIRHFRCGNGHEWEVPFEVMVSRPPEICPTCNTQDIMTLWPWRQGWGAADERRFRGGRNQLRI